MNSIKLLHYKIDSYSFITDKDAGKRVNATDITTNR